jgi:hypothetical protein
VLTRAGGPASHPWHQPPHNGPSILGLEADGRDGHVSRKDHDPAHVAGAARGAGAGQALQGRNQRSEPPPGRGKDCQLETCLPIRLEFLSQREDRALLATHAGRESELARPPPAHASRMRAHPTDTSGRCTWVPSPSLCPTAPPDPCLDKKCATCLLSRSEEKESLRNCLFTLVA